MWEEYVMQMLSRNFGQKTSLVIFAASSLFLAGEVVAISAEAPSDVQVKPQTLSCDKVNAKVKVPGVGVSIPDPGKLVPNVGRILREGTGVPAPDSNAPHGTVPKVTGKSPSADCESKDRQAK
jgi:hypothetical protein